ncbi:MAG: VanZ family protein [Eubacterium sp.]
MTVKQKRVVLWSGVIVWMALIFWFSAQNSDESSAMSGGIVGFIMDIIRHLFLGISEEAASTLEYHLVFIIRKAAHASIYCGLSILVYFAIDTINLKRVSKISITGVICLLYAASDELHQRFVPGRSCEFRDMCIDFGGALLGIGVVIFGQWMMNKIKHKK